MTVTGLIYVKAAIDCISSMIGRIFAHHLVSVMNERVQEAYPAQMSIADLLPTQVTVGMREVDIKRIRWRERSIDKRTHYLGTHRVPVIVGPDNRHYMIDRHHLTLALVCGGHC